jgi:copper chaperone CopZ
MRSVIEIDGMSCNHCVMSVRKELEKVKGVTIVDVAIGKAVLAAEMTAGLREEISSAILRAGYQVRPPS